MKDPIPRREPPLGGTSMARGMKKESLHMDGWLKDVGSKRYAAPLVQPRPGEVA